MTVLELPEDLAERLRSVADRLPRILELGLGQLDASLDPITNHLVALYNPRRNRWIEHFELVEATIAPLSAEGRATMRLLRLDHPDRLSERLLAFAAGLLNVPT